MDAQTRFNAEANPRCAGATYKGRAKTSADLSDEASGVLDDGAKSDTPIRTYALTPYLLFTTGNSTKLALSPASKTLIELFW